MNQSMCSSMSCIVNSLSQLRGQMPDDQKDQQHVLLVFLLDSVALAVMTTLAYLYYKWWSKHPLYGQNQGPKVYPVVGSILTYLNDKHRLLEYSLEMLSKYPNHTIRAVRPGGRNSHTTANPANVEHILKTNFTNYPKGEIFNLGLQDLLGDGIFNVDDHMWRIQRKAASYEFNTRTLRDLSLQSTAKEMSDRLVPFLLEASKSGQAFDLQDIFARFAFDNICQLGFGVDPACLDISLPRVKFAEAFDKATLILTKRLQAFLLLLWKARAALDIGPPRELRLAIAEIDEFAMRVIQNRRQELAVAVARGEKDALAGRADLLSRFMALVESENEGDEQIFAELSKHEVNSMDNRTFRKANSYKDVFLRDFVISFVLAGRDTTTSALSWFFWLISTHPNVEMAIVDEISQVLTSRPPAAGELGVDAEINHLRNSATFSFEELKSMHYLHAALTESMRLYPPVPSDVKTSRNADVWPDGTVIKPKSAIVYHPYSMGRLKDLWGKDAAEFKPERWLEDGVFVPQSPYKYPVFQAGPRTCLGKDMVMLQMKLISAAILRSFEICVPQDYKAQYLLGLTMRIKDGLPVTVRKRT